MTQGIIVSPANRGVQVVVTDENNVQLLVDSNRGVSLEIVPQPRIEVLVDKGVEGAQGPVGPQGPQGPQGTAATVAAGTTTTGLAGTNAIVTNSGTSSAAVFDFTIPRGDTGATGATGAGVAVGGTTGQVLVKASNVNYDTTWATITGTLVYQGSWNASTNTPTLTSSVGTNGYYYVVGTSGSTNLNGITDWVVGDWAIFNGTIWQKIDNTDLVSSVNGQTGVVVLDAADVGALSTLTSTDGSVTITSPNATTRDLSVAISGSTTNVVCLVRNTTGATLTKGTVVYISGATGQNPTVSKALATSDATSAQTLGMMTADLANNSNGYVTVIGLITNINTSAYTDGAQLYLSGTVAGAVTATKPAAPIHLVYVAIVEHAHPTQGKLFVKVQNGYELDEIHDVSIVSPTTGQTLVYSSVTDLWSNSNAPTITGGTIDNTVIGGTTPAAGTFTTVTTPIVGAATGSSTTGLDLNVNSKAQARIVEVGDGTRPLVINGGSSGGSQIPGISAPAVLGVSGGGGNPVRFYTNGRVTTQQLEVSHTASAVNYVQVTGAATTKAVIQSSQGSDSNISFVTQTKGTGAIDLAAGSSGVNISNGGTVTAITRTAAGSGYTSIPSVAISAPTTAGGVQSTATVGSMITQNPTTVQSGGTGYTAGDVLTIVGGTPVSVAATYTVATVSGGVITSVNPTNFAQYSVLPANPVSVTGGTGSSATLNLTYGVGTSAFTITNAGSGYVEQPTVTFSGGGGSGAAAYATVGSGTVIKSLGSTMSLSTASGEQVRIAQANPPVNYLQMQGNSASSSPILSVQGTDTNIGLVVSSKGSSGVRFFTNNLSHLQLDVAHTVSAVNYVQVTGAATGGVPIISSQGSDTNVQLRLVSKGSQGITFFTRGGSAQQFSISSVNNSVNYLVVDGAAAGTSPILSAQGSDTNVDLNLTTKGTGSLVFNTGNGIGFKVYDGSGGAAQVNYFQTRGRGTGLGPFFITEGNDTNVSANFGTKGTGVFSFLTSGASVEQFRISHTASAINYLQVAGGASNDDPSLSSTGSQSRNIRYRVGSGASHLFETGTYGNLQASVTHTASAVNWIQLTGAATGGQVFINSAGSDSNIGIGFTAKLFANINFFAAGGFLQFQVAPTASAVNYFQAKGGATGFGAVLSAQGSDTNIPAVVQPKGTGALQAQQTDSTATGGNARGARAVDWQTSRSSASQVASGSFSVVGGGSGNSATTTYSAALSGLANTSSGVANVTAGGLVNVGSGIFSAIVGGGYNTSGGWYNFIGGGFTNSGTANAAVTTQSGTMNGTTAVTLSGSNASIKVGQIISGTSIADDTYVAAISGTSLTLSKVASGSSTSTLSFFTPHGVVVGGGNNQATGSYSFIGGGGDAGSSANRNVASGDWSVVGGGIKNTATAAGSFVGGGGTYGDGSLGGNSAISQGASVVGGFNNVASGFISFVGGGNSNIANGQYSFIGGGAVGITRSIQGNHVFPAHNAPVSFASGSSQAGLLILGKETTNATPIVLVSGGSTAGTTNQVILPNNSAYFFTAEIISGVTGGGNTKGWTIEGVIKRGANAASTALVGTPTVTSTYADAGASTWVIAVTADTTNGGLAVTFTGQAATTIRTVCQIRTTEMTY